MIAALGFMAIGFGICFALTIVAVCLIDPWLIRTGRPSISRDTLGAGQRNVWVGVFVSSVFSLITGLLVGHLLLGQVETVSLPPPTAAAVQEILDASAPLPQAMRVTLASYHDCPCGPLCECRGCGCEAKPLLPSPLSPWGRGVGGEGAAKGEPGRPRLLAFSAPTCPACLRMKKDIEARPELQAAIAAKYDVTVYKEPRRDAEFRHYKIRLTPACILLDADGKELRRFSGYKSPAELARWLEVDARPHRQQPPEQLKPTLLYFSAVVSPASRWFERRTLADAGVVAKLANYNWTRYMAPGDRDLADKHGVTAVPTVILIGTDGREARRFVGYKSAADFLQWLNP